MVDRGANIDIVFRNGLKDYEVLPPADIWDNIHPVVAAKRKKRSFVFLKVAASVAALFTLGYIAYNRMGNVRSDYEISELAANDEIRDNAVKPFSVVKSSSNKSATDKTVAARQSQIASVENIPVDLTEKVISVDVNENASQTGNTALADLIHISKADNLTIGSIKPLSGKHLDSLGSLPRKSFVITEPEKQYSSRYSTVISGYGAVENTDTWSLMALASPTYASRMNYANDQLSKQLKESEKPVISYSGGVAFTYSLNKRLSIQSGLFYSSIGQEVDGISSFSGFRRYDDSKGDCNFKVVTSSGIIYAKNSDVYLSDNLSEERVLTSYNSKVFDPAKASLNYVNKSIRQDFSYLEFPVTMRYKVVDRTIDLNLIGGVSYNFLVNNSAYTVDNGSKYYIGKTDGLNVMVVSSSLGMGVEYKFSEKIFINLEPTFRYYLNPFTDATSYKIHPYSIGIFSGVSYKF
ncbi:MAG TPA: outer membrane beta-barrel protein [Bacteroidales bacterium]|nr:outer membrane beta-barrel protein [Bacteroidales bacterium]HPT21050.1 outer membrane beta-barrel protein [Bacteroidales bacterium]